jgi:phage terminase small subunit
MNDLTPKRTRFAEEYLVDLNAIQAAIRAGYSPKTAKQQGSWLLRKVEVAEAVAEAQAKKAAELELDHEWVLRRRIENLERAMQKHHHDHDHRHVVRQITVEEIRVDVEEMFSGRPQLPPPVVQTKH